MQFSLPYLFQNALKFYLELERYLHSFLSGHIYYKQFKSNKFDINT